MSSHINADLYWDKSDIKSHIAELKEFQKLVTDIKGAYVIDDAINFAEEVYGEMEWDEEDYVEFYEDKYEKELNELRKLAEVNDQLSIEINVEDTDSNTPYFDIYVLGHSYYNEQTLDYEETEKTIKKLLNGYKLLCIKSCICWNEDSGFYGWEIKKWDEFNAYKYENGTWCLCANEEHEWEDEFSKDNPDIGPNGIIPLEKFNEYFKIVGKLYEKRKS